METLLSSQNMSMAEFAIQLRMFPLFLILLRFLQQLIQNCHLRISTESFELSDDDGAPGEVDSEAESITHAATTNQDNATIRIAGDRVEALLSPDCETTMADDAL